MSEVNNGSAVLAGNQASNPAAGTNAGAGAPSATPNAAPASAAPASGNWYDSFEDNELKGYVANKGWKDPRELADGYRNLEKLLGGEKIPMPKGAEDKDGWNRVYDSLGRPKTADEYKLPVPEGDNGEFAKIASGKFHELGLSASQAQGLAEWWNSTQAAKMQEMNAQSASRVESEINSLKQEWGGAYDENLEFGRRAAREYGLTEEKLTKIENALGTGEMLKLMAQIGRAQGEAKFVDGENKSNRFGMTPDAARSRIEQLRGDRDWTAKYLAGNADATDELARLMKLAYPE